MTINGVAQLPPLFAGNRAYTINNSETKMVFTVTRLRTRGPRKGETMQRNSQHGRGQALGSISGGDSQTASHAVGGGKGLTITRQTGIGAAMVRDLDSVKRRAAVTYAADRRAAARERMEEKLNALLATV